MASSMDMLYIWHSQSIAFWTCSCMWPTLWMLFCNLRRILYLQNAWMCSKFAAEVNYLVLDRLAAQQVMGAMAPGSRWAIGTFRMSDRWFQARGDSWQKGIILSTFGPRWGSCS